MIRYRRPITIRATVAWPHGLPWWLELLARTPLVTVEVTKEPRNCSCNVTSCQRQHGCDGCDHLMEKPWSPGQINQFQSNSRMVRNLCYPCQQKNPTWRTLIARTSSRKWNKAHSWEPPIKPSPRLTMQDCPGCKGTGLIKGSPLGVRFHEVIDCLTCQGSGRVFRQEETGESI